MSSSKELKRDFTFPDRGFGAVIAKPHQNWWLERLELL
jgi:hypothetical protein